MSYSTGIFLNALYLKVVFFWYIEHFLIPALIFQNSVKFDPFLFLSVPLPKATRVFRVVFFPKDFNKAPVKVGCLFIGEAACKY